MSQSDFQRAATQIKQLRQKPKDEELLRAYALYKQATVGPCNTPKPGMFQFKDRSKHDAWEGLGQLSSGMARERYITLVDTLSAKYA